MDSLILDSGHPANHIVTLDGNLAALTMETVGFELALQLCSQPGKDFGEIVSEALESVGGTLLFDMPSDGVPDCRRIVAISLPSEEGRVLALVIQPQQDQAPRVELAGQSANPIARIVSAYAGVMDCLAA
jgi:hypothetical protein